MNGRPRSEIEAELAAVRRARLDTRRELLDCRARLGAIAQIVRDDLRVRRSPDATFGAVRAALFARSDRYLPQRRRI